MPLLAGTHQGLRHSKSCRTTSIMCISASMIKHADKQSCACQISSVTLGVLQIRYVGRNTVEGEGRNNYPGPEGHLVKLLVQGEWQLLTAGRPLDMHKSVIHRERLPAPLRLLPT